MRDRNQSSFIHGVGIYLMNAAHSDRVLLVSSSMTTYELDSV